MAMLKGENPPSFDAAVIFRQMVESALDFLEQARVDLETKPKYAVIHFATAIELILKARLLKEHWALVVMVSGDADRRSFQSGTAKTVTVDQAIKRLEQISAEPLPAGAADSFKVIAAHRNRMIHFFHEAASPEAEEAARARVTAELLLGWFHLLRLFRNWKGIFTDYEQDIRRVEARMQAVRAYLNVVYDTLKPQIAERTGSGTIFCNCPSCGYPSASILPVAGAVADLDCMVCGLSDHLVTMPCPQEDCQGTLHLTGYNTADEACDSCQQQVEKQELAAFLDTEDVDYPHFTTKNCGPCNGHGTVVQHNGLYVCTNCLSHAEGIPTCEWCNEMQLGYDLEFSYYKGCEFCDGKGGWDAD